MFDLSDRARAWIGVTWPGIKPGEDDALAVEIEHEVELFVEIVDRDELKELFPRLMGDEEAPTPTEEEIFGRLVTNWRKVLDNGKPVPFSAEAAARLIKAPMFGPSFTARYIAAVGGRVKLREGNSESLLGGGQADEPQAATNKRTPSRETAGASE